MKRTAKTRNAGQWTESRYWAQVRSALRRGFRFWKPITNALLAARQPYVGPNKLAKWHFRCLGCGGLFLRKDVQVHHRIECGQLKCPADLAPFLERLTAEDASSYQVLCKKCHQSSHEKQKNKAP